MRRRMGSVLLLAWAIALAACSDGGTGAADEPDDAGPVDVDDEGPYVTRGGAIPRSASELLPVGRWVISAATVDGTRLPPLVGARTIVSVGEDGWGLVDCVPDDLPAHLVDGGAPVGEALAILCGPAAGDGALFDALRRVDVAVPTSSGFALTGGGADVVLSTMPPLTADVFDREWRLVEWIPTLEHEFIPAVAPSVLRLDSDGTFEGTSGCGEEISGRWERQDDGLRMPRFDISAPCSDTDPVVVDQHGWVTMMGAGIRPILDDDGRMQIVIGVGASDRVNLVYE